MVVSSQQDKTCPPSSSIGELGAKRLDASSLPVIDIAPLFGGNSALKKEVANKIGRAARDVGFFYIKNHNIDKRTIDGAYNQAQQFFALSLKEKLKYYIGNSSNHRGYVPVTERGIYVDEQGDRHYEAFDLALDLPSDDPNVKNGHFLLGPNVWPVLSGFQDQVKAYYEAMTNLGQVLCRAFESHLSLPSGFLANFMTKPMSQLRLIHYIANDAPMDESDMNMGAHTDYECFTILSQEHSGLQVMNNRNEWLEAPPIEGAFVINIGDMLETWTNGLFKATLHRVVNKGEERYSIPFFAAANYDAVIEPLATVVSESHPPKYRKVIAGHHLLGQLLRDFSYLRKRHEAGELKLPFEALPYNPFERKLDLRTAA